MVSSTFAVIISNLSFRTGGTGPRISVGKSEKHHNIFIKDKEHREELNIMFFSTYAQIGNSWAYITYKIKLYNSLQIFV
jgi:hypothetical protein